MPQRSLSYCYNCHAPHSRLSTPYPSCPQFKCHTQVRCPHGQFTVQLTAKNVCTGGHDAHMAILLGAARLLKAKEQHLQGTVLLVFQVGARLTHMIKGVWPVCHPECLACLPTDFIHYFLPIRPKSSNPFAHLPSSDCLFASHPDHSCSPPAHPCPAVQPFEEGGAGADVMLKSGGFRHVPHTQLAVLSVLSKSPRTPAANTTNVGWPHTGALDAASAAFGFHMAPW